MTRMSWFLGVWLGWTVLAGAQGFDVERFFADNFIVDGLGSYWIRNADVPWGRHLYPSVKGPPDLSLLKKETGCNMAILSYRPEEYFERHSKWLKEGVFQNTRLIQTFSDVEAIRSSGEFGILMYVQKPFPLGGGISRIQEFYDKGLRVFQLAYGLQHHEQEPEDVLGYGCYETGGVTPLGKRVIAELNRLGMLVDVSHCNNETTLDACRLSTMPVVCTHAGAAAVTEARMNRNKSDVALKAIAATGGVVGPTCVGGIIENPKTKERGVSEFCDHLDYMKNLIGIDHVAVSTDAWLNGWDRSSPYYTSRELSDIGHWKNVAVELHSRGYTDEELKKVFGLNYLRVFQKVLKP